MKTFTYPAELDYLPLPVQVLLVGIGFLCFGGLLLTLGMVTLVVLVFVSIGYPFIFAYNVLCRMFDTRHKTSLRSKA